MTQSGIFATDTKDRLTGAMARVDAGLATPWWAPRLPGRLSDEFEASTEERNRANLRFWIGVIACGQVFGLLRDTGFGMLKAGLLLRCGLIIPLALAAIVLLGRRREPWIRDGLASLVLLVAVGTQISMGLMAAQPAADRYLMATVFAFSVLHLLMPFTFRQIIMHGALVSAALGAAAWVCRPADAMLIVDRLYILLPAATAIAAIGALVMLQGRRRVFMMDMRNTLQAEALEDANRALALLLRQDPLTGAYNRRYFDETMDTMWRRMQNSGTSIGLILIDVDHFKTFNDRQGHRAGDRCLKEVARCLSACLRDSDFVVARYGGEEFAVILPEASGVTAYAIGERLRLAVQALAWPHPAGGLVSVSVGTAACVPIAMYKHHTLVDAADRALYASKEGGRNCVTAGFVAIEPETRTEVVRAKVA